MEVCVKITYGKKSTSSIAAVTVCGYSCGNKCVLCSTALICPRVPPAALRGVLRDQASSRSWWPSPCLAAGARRVRAAVRAPAVPGRLKCSSPACHRCQSADLTQPPHPVTASRCSWKSTSPLVCDGAGCFGPRARGLSGLKQHPKFSELRTGTAILSIKHNICHKSFSNCQVMLPFPSMGSNYKKKHPVGRVTE